MSVLCHDQTHVYLTGSNLCTCGLNWYNWQEVESLTKHYPLSGGVIPGYTPNSFAPTRAPTPPTAGEEACDVPLRVLKAAQDVHATHLSADGKTAYDERQYGVWYCKWDEEAKMFGSWFKILDYSGLPPDAVAM